MSAPRSSTPPSTRRLLNELQSFSKEPNPCLLRLGLVNEGEVLHWEAVMKGVEGGAYEGKCGAFELLEGSLGGNGGEVMGNGVSERE